MEKTGRLEAIWLKPGNRQPMKTLEQVTVKAHQGLVGNANLGGRRQVTLIEKEIWTDLRERLGAGLEPIARRANLMVSGIHLRDTRGQVLLVGKCRIHIWGETRPCARMDEAWPGLKDALVENWGGGAHGEALDDGEIALGDPVRWLG